MPECGDPTANATSSFAGGSWLQRLRRQLWAAAGFFFVGLGIIGILLPVLPTTPFLILAAACFARASPRLEAWLLDHPKYGPLLQDWRARRAIPTRAKYLAIASMSLSYALLLLVIKPALVIASTVGLTMALSGLWIVTRPS